VTYHKRCIVGTLALMVMAAPIAHTLNAQTFASRAGPQITTPVEAPPVTAINPELRFDLLEAEVARTPDRYAPLWEAAGEGASLAASLPDKGARREILQRARSYAERAKVIEPEAVEGRYWLAVTAGMLAEEEGGRTKIRLAEQAWDESSWVLEVDPAHAGAHHVQGRLHAAVMRLNRVLRFLARKVLGGDVLGQASWDKAEYHLRSAAELAPEDAVNHLELGMALRDLDRPEEARQAFQRAASTAPRREADRRHIERALALLAESSG